MSGVTHHPSGGGVPERLPPSPPVAAKEHRRGMCSARDSPLGGGAVPALCVALSASPTPAGRDPGPLGSGSPTPPSSPPDTAPPCNTLAIRGRLSTLPCRGRAARKSSDAAGNAASWPTVAEPPLAAVPPPRGRWWGERADESGRHQQQQQPQDDPLGSTCDDSSEGGACEDGEGRAPGILHLPSIRPLSGGEASAVAGSGLGLSAACPTPAQRIALHRLNGRGGLALCGAVADDTRARVDTVDPTGRPGGSCSSNSSSSGSGSGDGRVNTPVPGVLSLPLRLVSTVGAVAPPPPPRELSANRTAMAASLLSTPECVAEHMDVIPTKPPSSCSSSTTATPRSSLTTHRQPVLRSSTGSSSSGVSPSATTATVNNSDGGLGEVDGNPKGFGFLVESSHNSALFEEGDSGDLLETTTDMTDDDEKSDAFSGSTSTITSTSLSASMSSDMGVNALYYRVLGARRFAENVRHGHPLSSKAISTSADSKESGCVAAMQGGGSPRTWQPSGAADSDPLASPALDSRNGFYVFSYDKDYESDTTSVTDGGEDVSHKGFGEDEEMDEVGERQAGRAGAVAGSGEQGAATTPRCVWPPSLTNPIAGAHRVPSSPSSSLLVAPPSTGATRDAERHLCATAAAAAASPSPSLISLLPSNPKSSSTRGPGVVSGFSSLKGSALSASVSGSSPQRKHVTFDFSGHGANNGAEQGTQETDAVPLNSIPTAAMALEEAADVRGGTSGLPEANDSSTVAAASLSSAPALPPHRHAYKGTRRDRLKVLPHSAEALTTAMGLATTKPPPSAATPTLAPSGQPLERFSKLRTRSRVVQSGGANSNNSMGVSGAEDGREAARAAPQLPMVIEVEELPNLVSSVKSAPSQLCAAAGPARPHEPPLSAPSHSRTDPLGADDSEEDEGSAAAGRTGATLHPTTTVITTESPLVPTTLPGAATAVSPLAAPRVIPLSELCSVLSIPAKQPQRRPTKPAQAQAPSVRLSLATVGVQEGPTRVANPLSDAGTPTPSTHTASADAPLAPEGPLAATGLASSLLKSPVPATLSVADFAASLTKESDSMSSSADPLGTDVLSASASRCSRLEEAPRAQDNAAVHLLTGPVAPLPKAGHILQQHLMQTLPPPVSATEDTVCEMMCRSNSDGSEEGRRDLL